MLYGMSDFDLTAVSSKLIERGRGSPIATWKDIRNTGDPADYLLSNYAIAAIADPNLVFSEAGLREMMLLAEDNRGEELAKGFDSLREEGILVVEQNPDYYKLETSVFELLAAGWIGNLNIDGKNARTEVANRRAKVNDPIPVPVLSRASEFYSHNQIYIVNPDNPDAHRNKGVQYLEDWIRYGRNLIDIFLARETSFNAFLGDLTSVVTVEGNGGGIIAFDYDELRVKYEYDNYKSIEMAIKEGLLLVKPRKNGRKKNRKIVYFDPIVSKYLKWQMLRVQDMDFVEEYARSPQNPLSKMNKIVV